MAVRFDWDPFKAKSNLRKHGVSFTEASTVLLDPLSKTVLDYDHSLEEDRFITVGISVGQRLLIVSYTEGDDVIRLISARMATRREQQFYEKH